ncbi:MAG: hypothetical protein EOP06_24635 [Proteobacteria bacterium]|nr:MAG: hypothetical protein EOP06_24635 [Pseudomonadota bacterium]
MKAIWDGQISSVYAIEKRSTNYLLFGTDCTVVYGEAKSSNKDNKKSEQL